MFSGNAPLSARATRKVWIKVGRRTVVAEATAEVDADGRLSLDLRIEQEPQQKRESPDAER